MSIATPIVFIVDDDESVRNSLSLLVESAGWRAETFGLAREFLSSPPVADAPSCLMLDVVLPDLNGCEVQSMLADRLDMPIIFISGYGDVPTAVRAMKGGAVEFFTKPFVGDIVLRAIRNAIHRSAAAMAHVAEMRALNSKYASLSPRERDVMAMVVSGRLNKQTGVDLGISEITVKAHRGQLMRKMNARSLCELVRMASKLSGDPAMNVGRPSGNVVSASLLSLRTGCLAPRDLNAPASVPETRGAQCLAMACAQTARPSSH